MVFGPDWQRRLTDHMDEFIAEASLEIGTPTNEELTELLQHRAQLLEMQRQNYAVPLRIIQNLDGAHMFTENVSETHLMAEFERLLDELQSEVWTGQDAQQPCSSQQPPMASQVPLPGRLVSFASAPAARDYSADLAAALTVAMSGGQNVAQDGRGAVGGRGALPPMAPAAAALGPDLWQLLEQIQLMNIQPEARTQRRLAQQIIGPDAKQHPTAAAAA